MVDGSNELSMAPLDFSLYQCEQTWFYIRGCGKPFLPK